MGGDSTIWFTRVLGGPLLFTLGAVAMGSGLGALLGWVGGYLPPVPVRVGVILVMGGLLLRPIMFPAARPPTSTWMIPRWWMRFGRPLYALLFGMGLGVGIATLATSGTIHVVLALAVFMGEPERGAGILAVFACARAVPLFSVGRCLAKNPGDLHPCMSWLEWSRPIPALLSRITVAFVAGTMLRPILFQLLPGFH